MPGEQGPPGASGVNCWDRNNNGEGDLNEDFNRDGKVNVDDCAGAVGPEGPMGPPGKSGVSKVQRLSQEAHLTRRRCWHSAPRIGGYRRRRFDPKYTRQRSLSLDPTELSRFGYFLDGHCLTVSNHRYHQGEFSVTAWVVCVEVASWRVAGGHPC